MEDRVIPLFYLLEDCPPCWQNFIRFYTESHPNWSYNVVTEDDESDDTKSTTLINGFLKEYSGTYIDGVRPKHDDLSGFKSGSVTFPSEKEKMLFLLKWS